jgi:hypothetical protein
MLQMMKLAWGDLGKALGKLIHERIGKPQSASMDRSEVEPNMIASDSDGPSRKGLSRVITVKGFQDRDGDVLHQIIPCRVIANQ